MSHSQQSAMLTPGFPDRCGCDLIVALGTPGELSGHAPLRRRVSQDRGPRRRTGRTSTGFLVASVVSCSLILTVCGGCSQPGDPAVERPGAVEQTQDEGQDAVSTEDRRSTGGVEPVPEDNPYLVKLALHTLDFPSEIYRDPSSAISKICLEGHQIVDSDLVWLQHFQSLRSLELVRNNISDKGLQNLGDSLEQLPKFSVLSLVQEFISDDGLLHLQKAPRLTTLQLNAPRITDRGLEHLALLQELRDLAVINHNVSDDGLRHLQSLKSLMILELITEKITDDGLAHLAPLNQLRMLWIRSMRVTDAGMVTLSRLQNLERLVLEDAEITEKGLRELTKLDKLKSLQLDNCALSDSAIPLLAGFTRLNTLEINLDGFTDQGVDTLAAAMPNCWINGVDPRDPQVWARGRAYRLTEEQLQEVATLLSERPSVRIVEVKRLTSAAETDKSGSADSLQSPGDGHAVSDRAVSDRAVSTTEWMRGGRSVQSRWTVSFIDASELVQHRCSERIELRDNTLYLRWQDHRGVKSYIGKWISDNRTLHWDQIGVNDDGRHELMYRFLDDHRCRYEEWMTSGAQRKLVMQGEFRPANATVLAEQLRMLGGQLELGDQGKVIGVNLGRSQRFRDHHAGILSQLPYLTKVDLQSCSISDRSLYLMGELDNLQVLDLSSTYVSNGGMAYLKRMKNLKSLSLQRLLVTRKNYDDGLVYNDSRPTTLTDAGVAHLSHIKTLESLDLRMTDVTNAGLQHLVQLDSLSHVHLPEQIDDDGLVILSQMNSLRSLDIGSSFITDVGLRRLLKMTQLESLRFNATYVPTQELLRLNELPNLVSIGMIFNDVDERILETLKSLEHLTELHCAFTGIGDDAIAHISEMRRLKSVNLAGTKITDAGMVHLRSLKDLEELVLFSTAISDAGLMCVQDLVQMRSLILSDTRITDGGLIHIRGLRNLEQLDLNSNFHDAFHYRNGNPELGRLGVLKKLKLLELNLAFASKRDIEKLRKSLPDCEINANKKFLD